MSKPTRTMNARHTLGFVGLNIVRAISIVSLVFVLVLSVRLVSTDLGVMKNALSKKPAAPPSNSTSPASHAAPPPGTPSNPAVALIAAIGSAVCVIVAAVALILSELEWPMEYWNTYFPVLSSRHGLGPLGVFEIFIGVMTMNQTTDNLAVLAGLLLLCIGLANLILGGFLRGGSKDLRSIKSWRARKNAPILPEYRAPVFRASLFPAQYSSVDSYDALDEKTGYGFGKEGEKKAGLIGYNLTPLSETVVHSDSRLSNESGVPPLRYNSLQGRRFRSSPKVV